MGLFDFFIKKSAPNAAQEKAEKPILIKFSDTDKSQISGAENRPIKGSIHHTDAAKTDAKPIASHTAVSDQTSTPLPLKIETQYVVGTKYRTKEILSLAYESMEYDCSKKELIEDNPFMCVGDCEKIYRYSFSAINVELVPEPDNEYDRNAIKVVIDGAHVGYISRGNCPHIKKLIANGKIQSISAEIYGGDYKLLSCSDNEFGEETYTLRKGTSEFRIKLSIYCCKST